jgi:hypothetical protein
VLAPQIEYSQRLEARQKVFASKERAHIRIGNYKLLIIAAGLVAAWLSLRDHKFSAAWLAVPLLIYFTLAVLHEQVLRARNRSERAASFYRRGIGRIEDRWVGSGETGEAFLDDRPRSFWPRQLV